MNKIIKNTLLAGIGAAVLTKEKMDSTFNDLVREGRIGEKDARLASARIAKLGRAEFITATVKAGRTMKKVLAKADRMAEARIDRTVARVRKLEAKPARRRPARGR